MMMCFPFRKIKSIVILYAHFYSCTFLLKTNRKGRHIVDQYLYMVIITYNNVINQRVNPGTKVNVVVGL